VVGEGAGVVAEEVASSGLHKAAAPPRNDGWVVEGLVSGTEEENKNGVPKGI